MTFETLRDPVVVDGAEGHGRADTGDQAPTRAHAHDHDDHDGSLAHLLGRLGVIEARVRVAVQRRREVDPDPDDPVRGLYVADHDVDRLLDDGPWRAGLPPPERERLATVEAAADRAADAGTPTRLRRLRHAFGLDPLDVEVLLAALAPDLDRRFEWLYGYLHDDITRRRASVGLALELAGLEPTSAVGRAHLRDDGRLLAHRLVVVEDAERPLATRALRVPDRVTGWLLGDDDPPEELVDLLIRPRVVDVGDCHDLARALSDGHTGFVRERPGTAPVAVAVAAADAAGHEVLVVDLARPGGAADSARTVAVAAREATLAGTALVVDGVQVLVDDDPAGLAPLLSAPCPVVLVGTSAWDPAFSDRPPLQVPAPRLQDVTRTATWDGLLDAADLDPATAMAQFRLTPIQAARTATVAQLRADAADRDVTVEDLRAGARECNAGRLEDLARRLEPTADFADLVLPDRAVALLDEIVDRVRHHDRVLGDWDMGGRADRGHGVTALFAGPSGTGKTLSAEVVAGELGLDLYTIDLSTVVDKYIGETEKNLERIFDQAEGVNGVLFFDEADALFGKRSEVSDAHDRYANVEIAFLLQRMEHFDGIAILATNLRANLDEAFTRRLDVLIDFPEPEADDRRRLWDLHLPDALPRTDDVDLPRLADAFELTGGDIRNVTVAAAYAAASDDQSVCMSHLVRATAREYRKLGRLVTESEFSPWFDLLDHTNGDHATTPTNGRSPP